MNWSATCAVVIPCHNEAASILQLVKEVRHHLPQVVVVDDCSDDHTASEAAQAGAQVVRRSKSRGKGAAIKAGIAAAMARKCTSVITLDGDGQHRPEDISIILRCAEETKAALVIGDRMHCANKIPWVRRKVNRWMSRRISAIAGQYLSDSQCGFRLIDLEAWTTLDVQANHFEIESEMLLAFVRSGYRVEFVPVQVVGRSRRSRIRPLIDTWRWLLWWRRSKF